MCDPAALKETAAAAASRVRSDQDRPRRCGRLKARRDVDEVARHHALTLCAHSDRRLAGEHARSQLQIGGADLSPQRGYLIDELQRGPDRSLGVVLVRHRRAPHTAMTASPLNFSTIPP
ncbi:MAG: hypothetical protein M3Q18_00155 [Actinomycetota bacterium]|nr:hypothetical protein [Actinomycetota bacterium]